MADPKHDPSGQRPREPENAERRPQVNPPAEEWGTRQSQATGIARGGKHDGPVDGATEQKP